MGARDKLIILLPPSEGKANSGKTGTRFKPESGMFGKALGQKRSELIVALKKAGGGSEKLLGVSGQHLARAKAANRALRGAPTLPASSRYTGVVWDHLDLVSLPTATQKVAAKQIVVVSGLLGLVACGDETPEYRLKIGASLAPFGKLASWWRADLSAALNEFCKNSTVVDLLPQEHAAAFIPDRESIKKYFRVDLATASGAAGGHDAKAAKGRLARHLLLNYDKPTTALKSFKDPRFRVRILEQF